MSFTDQFIIRPLLSTELSRWQSISRRTFVETFAKDNTAENMSHYLSVNFSLQQLREEFNDPKAHVFIILIDVKVVGYLKLIFNNEECSMEIERIYVLKDFHGQGVGQLLLDKAIELARNANCHSIWLGVWEHNPRAIRFYEKNGFLPYGSHVFKLGSDAQRDVLMRLDV